jgi:hypothetical protein
VHLPEVVGALSRNCLSKSCWRPLLGKLSSATHARIPTAATEQPRGIPAQISRATAHPSGRIHKLLSSARQPRARSHLRCCPRPTAPNPRTLVPSRFVLVPKAVLVEPPPYRAFQGWRYLEEKDAPRDLDRAAPGARDMPETMRRELRQLGLL